jgi:3-phosphoshikimate 1-carboxyvinyltransferase
VKFSSLSNDIKATLSCCQALGARVEVEGEYEAVITPSKSPHTEIFDCGESGSTLRFLLPVAAVCCNRAEFRGGGRLPDRPITDLRAAMEENGASFSGDRLPLTVMSGMRSGVYRLRGDVSSQYISGLLFALPLCSGDSEIVLTSPLCSAGYVDMTIETLSLFSVEAVRTESGYFIEGGQKYISPCEIAAEGDWSNSSFWLAAGAIGRPVTVTGLSGSSLQRDRSICELLSRFGAEVSIREDEASVSPKALRGIEIDASEIPDAVPVLAVAAAAAEGVTRIYNAARLRIKESDRLSSVSNMINNLGGVCTETEDGLVIEGRGTPLRGGTVDSCNDHRIAMAAAIASVICREKVTIIGSTAADKSYPTFFEDMKSLGGRIIGWC